MSMNFVLSVDDVGYVGRLFGLNLGLSLSVDTLAAPMVYRLDTPSLEGHWRTPRSFRPDRQLIPESKSVEWTYDDDGELKFRNAFLFQLNGRGYFVLAEFPDYDDNETDGQVLCMMCGDRDLLAVLARGVLSQELDFLRKAIEDKVFRIRRDEKQAEHQLDKLFA